MTSQRLRYKRRRASEVKKQFATPISRTVKSAIHKCNLKRRLRANRGRRPPGARKQFGILSVVRWVRGMKGCGERVTSDLCSTLGARWAKRAKCTHAAPRRLDHCHSAPHMSHSTNNASSENPLHSDSTLLNVLTA